MSDAPDSFAGALVAAILAALKTAEHVAALVGRNVYDIVPGLAGTPHAPVRPPWISIGPIGGPRFQNDGYRAWRPRVRLFVMTESFNRSGAWSIVDAIDTALDGVTLDLGDAFTMAAPLEAAECGDIIDPTKPRAAFADFECVIFRAAPIDADNFL